MSADYKNNPLANYNNEKILGKGFAGDENRNPKQISLTAKGPYNVSQLSYPEDISEAPDLQHYMVFYINVRGKTKFKPEKIVNVDVSSKFQNRLSAENKTNTGVIQFSLAAGAAAGALGQKLVDQSGAGGAIDAFLTRKFGAAGGIMGRALGNSKIAAAVIGGAGSLAGGALAKGLTAISDNLKTDEPKRLTDAIVLPIDSIPKVSYGMTYDEYDAGVLAGTGIFGGSSAIDRSGSTQEATLRAILTIADINKAAGLGNTRENLLSGGAVQTNPFREVFFKSINFREFDFSYTFLPKSEREVYNVKRIIDMFKFHMHPELSTGGLFYVYPSEFDISYYYKGAENEFINKISTCVLKNLTVDYGGQYFTSFENGAPAEIRMTLRFRELELLSKERIIKGY